MPMTPQIPPGFRPMSPVQSPTPIAPPMEPAAPTMAPAAPTMAPAAPPGFRPMPTQPAEQSIDFGGGFIEALRQSDEEEIAKSGIRRDLLWRNVMLEGFRNLPKSIGKEVASTAKAATVDIVPTLNAVGQLIEGAVSKAIPGEQEAEKSVDLLVDYAKTRYGTMDGFKKALAKEPASVLSDIVGALVPAGSAISKTGQVSKMAKVQQLGQTIAMAGAGADPWNLIRRAGSQVTRILPQTKVNRMYQSAIKMNRTLGTQARKRITKTGLDNAIMPSIKGLDQLRSQVNVLNNEITGLIDAATEAGTRIPVKRLNREFRRLKDHARSVQLSEKAFKAINSVQKELYTVNQKINRKSFTPQELQATKQAIYSELGNFYTKATQSPAHQVARAGVAKAAKEALEEIYPEIKHLNKTESSLLELMDVIEGRAAGLSNADLTSFGMSVKSGAGQAIAGTPGLVGGIALGLFDTAPVKAKLAIVANQLKNKGIKLNPAWAEVRSLAALPTRTGLTAEEENTDAASY